MAPYSVIIIVTSRVSRHPPPLLLQSLHGQALSEREELKQYAEKLEKATIDTVEGGRMTGDLAIITSIKDAKTLNSTDFIKAIRTTLEAML